MCGIVGYIGNKDARQIVLDGLSLLEYRGYDSAGICQFNGDSFEIFKDKGRVNNLINLVDKSYNTNYAIGHTRWATHGVPNKVNSHPHMSMNKRFVIVHNGVIENFRKLKIEYLQDYHFESDTDTEVIVNLIDHFSFKMSVSDSIRKTLSLLEGSYALLIIDTSDHDTLYAAKNKSPLVLGKSKDGISIASDVMALEDNISEYAQIDDISFVIITKNEFKVYDIIGIEQKVELLKLLIEKAEVSKGNYEHYMLKEIYEQPGVVRRLITKYFEEEKILINEDIVKEMQLSDSICIIACGTSYYAGLVGKYFFEKLCNIPTNVYIASEVAYEFPLLSKKPFCIVISQSGETADSINCLKQIKKMNIPSLAITNIPTSTLARESKYSLDIFAGPEIAVASTKAYTAMVIVLSILAKAISKKKTNLKLNLSKVALSIEDLLSNSEIIESIASDIKDKDDCFYIGRGLDYYASLEMALKLKEISYIHTDPYPSGELKHGSIALIEKGFPVIAVITQEDTATITRTNLEETVARGAKPIIIAADRVSMQNDDFIISGVASYLMPIVSVVFGQLLSYYVSLKRGNDVDKPKNLAKSVTVE